MLRDELLTTVAQVGGRLGELRFDTDLDVSHAVVRYLELLKLAALLERTRADGQAVADALPEVNARLLQAVTAEQREIFETERARRVPARRRARRAAARAAAVAARDGAVAGAVPARGAATGCCCQRLRHRDLPDVPAEVQVRARLPDPAGADAQPALRDPRPPGARALPRRRAARARCAELLGLLEAGWRRGGFGDSEEERQLRAKATQALVRYHERFQAEEARAGLVRALVLVPARARTCCAAASTASTGCPTAATS